MRMSDTVLKSKYKTCADLGGKSILRTIKDLFEVDMDLPGEQERKVVVFFDDDPQGLVLNKTNARALVEAFGDDTEGWIGEEVVLYPDRASYMGKIHDVVRVRKPKNQRTVQVPAICRRRARMRAMTRFRFEPWSKSRTSAPIV